MHSNNFLKTFMDKGYSIYKIDKENLIDSISKSTLYYQQKNKTVLMKIWILRWKDISKFNFSSILIAFHANSDDIYLIEH